MKAQEWVPDEEEKAIIARAVKRLQARLAGAVDPCRDLQPWDYVI